MPQLDVVLVLGAKVRAVEQVLCEQIDQCLDEWSVV